MKYKYRDQTPELIWDEKGQPLSKQFDDIYYSPYDGLAESRHVFLAGNDLETRWHSLRDNQVFTVFECGFGTGLNFMAAVNLWLQMAPGTHLQYTSLEGYPLSKAQLERALEPWKSLLPLESAMLIQQYESVINQTGFIEVSDTVSVRLIQAVADNNLKLDVMPDSIDAIFMDGFSPGKNPDMWSTALCHQLFKIAKPGASLATFSVAGLVKRNLKEAGFELHKRPGFGKKREMLTAIKPVDDREPGHHNP